MKKTLFGYFIFQLLSKLQLTGAFTNTVPCGRSYGALQFCRAAVDRANLHRKRATNTETGHNANWNERHTRTTMVFLDPSSSNELFSPGLPSVPLMVTFALTIGFAAQSLINKQLNGDQGLGAFLRDGSGYSKSGFRPVTSDKDRALSGSDPLPWLKLPKLNFVDVAGQEQTELSGDLSQIFETLENLRLELNQQLAKGNQSEANLIQGRMQKIMAENGIDYQSDTQNN